MSDLERCPFCGAGTFEIRPNGRMWLGMKYSEPASVSVLHWCEATPGQPSRVIERVGRDEASAIEAWNRRAQPAQAGQVLTDAQANEIAKASFEKLCGRPHPWEGAQPWVIDAIKRAANGIVGEKGGQHG